MKLSVDISMGHDTIHPALRETASDIITAMGGRAADFVLPVFGSSLLNAVVGEVGPKRMERFALFMTKLDHAVKSLEDKVALVPPLSGEKLGLFEDGARVAIKALSDERLDQLAHLVAEGLTGSDIEASDNRRLLEVIEQLRDDEVVYLFSFSRPGQDPEWREKHRALIDPFEEARAHNQYRDQHPDMSPESPEAATTRYLENRRIQIIYDLREKKLFSLGVVRREQVPTTEAERASGKVRYYPVQLSALGELVLSRLGLL